MPLATQPAEVLARYNLPQDALERTNLSWDELAAIYADHEASATRLEPTAGFIVECLRRVPEVHSLRYRIKSPEHLIAKIIRKKLARPDDPQEVTKENYRDVITDLIGIRALHLFKDEWLPIHEFVMSTWELHEQATANIRRGDAEEFKTAFEGHGCVVNEHPAGYRSIHYLIKFRPGKDLVIAELQVRTLFEEGWSEIDHRVRYPHAVDNAVLAQFLDVFNRLAGSADEMGTYVKFLQTRLADSEGRFREAETKLKERAKELEDAISRLDIAGKEREALEEKVRDLTTEANQGVRFQGALGRTLHSMMLSGPPNNIGSLSPFPGVTFDAPSEGISITLGERTCVVCGQRFSPSLGMSDTSRCPAHQDYLSLQRFK